MDKYEVMLYPKAFRDIDDIYAYIAFEKLSPENYLVIYKMDNISKKYLL